MSDHFTPYALVADDDVLIWMAYRPLQNCARVAQIVQRFCSVQDVVQAGVSAAVIRLEAL